MGNILQKRKVFEGEDYYKFHLRIINPFLKEELTKIEISILSIIMNLEESLVEDGHFNKTTRAIVKEKLKLSSSGLSTHVKSMTLKGVLNKSEISKIVRINENIIPKTPFQGYQFKIVKNEVK